MAKKQNIIVYGQANGRLSIKLFFKRACASINVGASGLMLGLSIYLVPCFEYCG